MTVLVAGATGVTGSAVLAHLVAAGVETRAMSRSADNAEQLRRSGADVVVAPFDDADALRSAFSGVTAAYLATPSSPDMAATESAFARVAADAHAHLVKLSVIGAAVDSPLRFARHHAESEQAIEAIGGTWTFLQPNGFMQNNLDWATQIPSGTIAGPVMDAAWSIVDVADIAAVAVAALTSPDAYASRRIVITGPQARTPRDLVGVLAKEIGRELDVIDVPIVGAKDQLRSFGVPEWYVEGLGELFELYATGAASAVSPDAEAVLQHGLRTWEDFVTNHREHFDPR